MGVITAGETNFLEASDEVGVVGRLYLIPSNRLCLGSLEIS